MANPEDSSEAAAVGATLKIFSGLGDRLGLSLYRLSLRPDSSGEVEFESPNPVETLVLKWDGLEQLYRILCGDQELSVPLVTRKKCTRCLLHERPWPADETGA